MSDIVEKARGEWQEWMRHPDNAEDFSLEDVVAWINQRPAGAFLLLADEITRLKAEVAQWKEAFERTMDDVAALRDENERLKASEEAYRKTLRGIVRQCNNTGYGSPSVMERMIDRIEDMAIDALGTHRHASKEVND